LRFLQQIQGGQQIICFEENEFSNLLTSLNLLEGATLNGWIPLRFKGSAQPTFGQVEKLF
jgi:hypothetical protein